jgi:hypothetical protein
MRRLEWKAPDGWAHEAGGFPIMTLPLGFLMKDVLFLVASPKAGSNQKTTGLWLIKGTSISAVYWLHFWMLKAKNVKTIAPRIK